MGKTVWVFNQPKTTLCVGNKHASFIPINFVAMLQKPTGRTLNL